MFQYRCSCVQGAVDVQRRRELPTAPSALLIICYCSTHKTYSHYLVETIQSSDVGLEIQRAINYWWAVEGLTGLIAGVCSKKKIAHIQFQAFWTVQIWSHLLY